MDTLFNDIYRGKKVFITGHTGFKGSWLALWLTTLGAEVIGYSIDTPTSPCHFDVLKLKITSITDDILDQNVLQQAIERHKPDIVFHLAAQALVLNSYADPAKTFATNVLGTVNLLENCRLVPEVKAIINVTSDKCYANAEHIWAYREIDPMGGDDPYSASKGAAELASHAYRQSFFNNADYGTKHSTLLANVRAGNVIGGGDWAANRLIPDIIRAMERQETLIVRNPQSIRPWQHVLEPVSGYLQLGQKLLEGNAACAEDWNFGPGDESVLTVLEVLQRAQQYLNGLRYEVKEDLDGYHEAHLLRLDSSKARLKLHWQPVWDSYTAVEKTMQWYKKLHNDAIINSMNDLESYIDGAKSASVEWAV